MSNKHLYPANRWKRQRKQLPNASTAACAETQNVLTEKALWDSVRLINDVHIGASVRVRAEVKEAMKETERVRMVEKPIVIDAPTLYFATACSSSTAAPPGTFDGAWFNVGVSKRPYRVGEPLR